MPHTPEPWQWCVNPNDAHELVVFDEANWTIAWLRVVSQEKPREELEANARLIAAAPELLAALERIRDMRDAMADGGPLPPDGRCFDDWASDVADAAIAKAKGGA